MRRNRTVRLIDVEALKDEIALVQSEDYCACVERLLAKDDMDATDKLALQRFLDAVVPHFYDAHINRAELYNALHPTSVKKAMDMVRILMREGLLLRRVDDDLNILFSVPRAGKIWKYVRDGAREIANILSRCEYHEKPLMDLETSRLRRSCFNATYHIQQMVGSSKLMIIPTTSGTIARLRSEGEIEAG
mmetsp:Transcript_12973/g.39926  ORF Transcript_12973/g.39926 Transcript_12973/m.39926 type:complete len:190 (-) Transcript_12973:1494-2063(-)